MTTTEQTDDAADAESTRPVVADPTYAALGSAPSNQTPLNQQDQPTPAGHRRNRWLMMLMCLPMLALIGVLIASGAVGGGALIYAVLCMAMMGAMMLFMGRNH